MVLASGTVPVSAALALVAAAYGAGPLIGALAGLAPHRNDLALGPYLRHSSREVVGALAGTMWQLAGLLTQAMHNLDAIARALARQWFTRRHLLQWTTAAAARGRGAARFARTGPAARGDHGDVAGHGAGARGSAPLRTAREPAMGGGPRRAVGADAAVDVAG